MLSRTRRRARKRLWGGPSVFDVVAGSWNARGLLVKDGKLRKSKIEKLANFTRNCDIFGVQEAHGNEVRAESSLGPFRRSFHIFLSLPTSGGGGLIVFVRKSFCPDINNICFTPICVGRIVRVAVFGAPSVVGSSDDSPKVPHTIAHFVHNFSVPHGLFLTFRNTLTYDCSLVDSHPGSCRVLTL